MQLSITLQQYLQQLRGFENHSLTLELMLQPFGLEYHQNSQSNLLVGFLIEHLLAIYSRQSEIDPIDIAAAAYELGFDAAGDFLDRAPLIMAGAVSLPS